MAFNLLCLRHLSVPNKLNSKGAHYLPKKFDEFEVLRKFAFRVSVPCLHVTLPLKHPHIKFKSVEI